MKFFNIYDFIPASNISKYFRNTGHIFTSLEMAALVFCSEKTVMEKHEAYRQIIAEYSDMPVPAMPIHDVFAEKPSLHEMLREIIDWEEKAIVEFMTPVENAFYCPELLADQGHPYALSSWGMDSGIYSTLEKAINAFERLALGSVNSVERVSVTKMYIDDEHLNKFLSFNFSGEIIDVPMNYELKKEYTDHLWYIAKDVISSLKMKIPAIKRLTDNAVRDAVFAIISDVCREEFNVDTDGFMDRLNNRPETIDFDFDNIKELELIMPESLEDLWLFPNLERLVVRSSSSLSFITNMLRNNSVEWLSWQEKLKEIILNADIVQVKEWAEHIPPL